MSTLRRSPRTALSAALLGAALFTSPAAAQALAECEATDPTTAEVNAREGVRLAKAGKFADAVPLFRMAVRLDACAPEHLLLLARGLARSDQTEDARSKYQAVLDTFPDSLAAQRAKKELAALPKSQPKPAEPIPGVGGTLEPTPPAGPNWRLIGLSTAGAGALITLGGVYFALDAQSADDDLQTAARQPDRAKYDTLVDQRDRSTTLSYAFYGIGGAALIAGATMAILPLLNDAPPAAESADDAPQASFMPLHNGGMVVLGGAF